MFANIICILLLCITYSNASGNVVETITVDNGGIWGNWKRTQFCPSGQHAIGYKLKIEKKQRKRDDTSLNGIELFCGTADSRPIHGATVTSGVGPWGKWHRKFALCSAGEFLSSFKMQVEKPMGRSDETAANFVVFRCRGLKGGNEKQLSQGNGRGFWGTYGSWSSSCPSNSSICGLKTKVERRRRKGDDTALNDVMFYCCSD